jgi:hypothetical protein
MVDGELCGRPAARWCQMSEGDVALCELHARRFRAGLREEALARPIAVRQERAPYCEVVHDGEPCGRSTEAPAGGFVEVDGARVSACQAHHRRWRDGKRGEAFTKPIRTRRRSRR